MRSPIKLQKAKTPNQNVDVCVVPPHEFAIEHQQQLLPGWQTDVSYLILVLQQSSLSLKSSTPQVALEKNRLRAEFIRMGCTLIFALQDLGYESDLFDPRTGYPLIAEPNMAFDDNAAVKALLNYPVVAHEQCSLITHPVWGQNVYPSTIATAAADLKQIESCLSIAIASQNWSLSC